MLCEELPGALRALKVDAIVSDWIEPAAGLVAHHMGIPYVSVAAALPLNWEAGIPSPFVGWSYGKTRWHRYRNIAAQHVAQMVQNPLHAVIREYATRWSLEPKWTVQHCASGFAQIAQLTPSLDYPRRNLIGCFHYCGPLRSRAPKSVKARRTTGRAFASLGSLQGHRADIFERIADATDALGLDLTIAHGGRLAASSAERLARRATVHDFVAYDRIMPDIDIAILHGGMNGTLDALAHGVPTVTLPLAFEQAAIAERTRYAGVGLVCRPTSGKNHLARTIREVIDNPSYADAAASVGAEIRAAGGVARAADIVEQVARTGQPCLNADMVATVPHLAQYGLNADGAYHDVEALLGRVAA